jgi:ornithine decarboxylase
LNIIHRVSQDPKITDDMRLSRTLAVIDLDRLEICLDQWRQSMPFAEPWYAIKCFSDDRVIEVMHKDMGFGFDCASRKEMQLALDKGVCPDRIVYAHPCKRPEDLTFAAKHGIHLMTVDNVSEVDKIARVDPEARLLLRIKVDGSYKSTGHLIPMAMKYGAHMSQVPDIVYRIQVAKLDLVGVSFHVGSGCEDPRAFSGVIRDAREVFTLGRHAGFDMAILDLGGGFRSTDPVMFAEIASEIRKSLQDHGFFEDGTKIIAEPGRFFAESLVTLATPIIGKCTRDSKVHYFISDGIYGSFNCLLYEHKHLAPTLDPVRRVPYYDSVVWGPTCDSTDCVIDQVSLPSVDIGDYLIFENAGAYTLSGACDFNGIEFTRPIRVYVRGHSILDITT